MRWPDQEVPGLRAALFGLANLILEAGQRLAQLCDLFVSSRKPGYQPSTIARSLRRPEGFKARILHYYPRSSRDPSDVHRPWCGLHTDTGTLTGATPSWSLRCCASFPYFLFCA